MASGNPFLEMGGAFGGFDAPQDAAVLGNPFIGDGLPAGLANNPFGAFLVEAPATGCAQAGNPFAEMAPPSLPAAHSPAPPPPHPPPPPPRPPAPVLDLTDSGAPPPRPPVPEATRHLLASVTGHMEAASDSLFGQLNNVRTPRQSPTHMSRSPTPPLDDETSAVTTMGHGHHDAAFSVAFGQTVEELSDHEETRVPSPGPTVAPEIDLWDAAPATSKPKTMDQILSLFNAPAITQRQEVDLLCGSFHDDVPRQPTILDGMSAASPTSDPVGRTDAMTEPPQPAAVPALDTTVSVSTLDTTVSVPTLDATVPVLTLDTTVEGGYGAGPDTTVKTSAEPEPDHQPETAGELAVAPTPAAAVRASSPSEEEALRPMQLEIDVPVVLLTGAEPDDRVHTAAAFMAEFCAPAAPAASITPPSPMSPLRPSPLPSSVTTPTAAGGSPPGQYQLTPPEEVAPRPPPPRPAAPPARPPLPSVDDIPAAPPASPFNIFNERFESAPSAGAQLDFSGLLDGQAPAAPEPEPLDIFGNLPATVAPLVAALDIFSAASEPAAPSQAAALDIFAAPAEVARRAPPPAPPRRQPPPPSPNPFLETTDVGAHAGADAFDAFAERFEKAADEAAVTDPFDPFVGQAEGAIDPKLSAWGGSEAAPPTGGAQLGFDDSAFDAFLSMTAPPPVPQSTPARGASKQHSEDETADINVFIRPQQDWASQTTVPTLAPPPRPAVAAFQDMPDSPGIAATNPFVSSTADLQLDLQLQTPAKGDRAADVESASPPATPLFDDDVSQPLEAFPRTLWESAEFEMFLRQPNKKKITGQRFWKKVFVRLADNAVLQLFNDSNDNDPFQELPLQPSYSVSDVGAQQYDQYGKIFTVKLQYIFYKERPGVRPGQLTKAERITKKIGQFAISAWEGDYDRVKEFASDVRKLGMPVEHAPQISQLLKLGTQHYEEVKRFASYIEETLFKVNVHRDRALNYKTEEVQITGVDEVYVEQDVTGAITTQLARVRLFFLAFLSGMPDIELGINDLRRQGREVVGRHDIIPVATEEWIRLEDVIFHNVIDLEAFKESQMLKFKPPDGCYIELMRFRVRPPRGRELPLQVKAKYTILSGKVEISADILVPGFISRKMGQIPCEDVWIRIPLPECWIYMFRVEKHFRYGSVKASHRRQGKVKGIERLLGTVDTLEQSMMEVSSGSAKYEHHHRAIVWRIPRLPKEGQGAYTNHTFSCKLNLTSFDQMPETFDKHCWVEYTMPHTTVSHTVCRSASVSGGGSDSPEKYVRYLARYEYKVEMEFCYTKDKPAAYISATQISAPKPVAGPPPPRAASSDSDSDSE